MLDFFRYFFVIDDIWDESVWEIIHCNYQHEFVYKMSPLDDQNSRKLFFSTVGQNDSLYIFILTKLKKN